MDHVVEESREETVENETNEVPLKPIEYIICAGFWIRFWAYLFDMIVVGSLHRILVYPLLRWLDISIADSSLFSITAILTAAIMYAYFIVMTKLWGQTLGKMFFGLKVIHEKSETLSWLDVVFRELFGKFISKTVLFLGFITIAFTPNKKGWHDFFADTIVIREQKGFVFSQSKCKVS